MEKNAKVIKGPSISAGSVPEAKEDVVKWLKEQDGGAYQSHCKDHERSRF
ncbi:MAG: hypothetical protein LUH63_16720 [Parabacteroides sp.]|nr:hypothetical protein [Parabacteroides sp.]